LAQLATILETMTARQHYGEEWESFLEWEREMA
jgi:hypothetical protein